MAPSSQVLVVVSVITSKAGIVVVTLDPPTPEPEYVPVPDEFRRVLKGTT
jgi:hypothetical protein